MRDGWQVVGIDRNPSSAGIETRIVDLMQREAVHATVRTQAFERIDAFIHAAGFMKTGSWGALDHDAGAAMWAVHVEAAQILVDELAPKIANGGRVVLAGSRAATGLKGRSQYGATKAALSSLARSWAAELIDRGITVNVVAPAATDTPMLRATARADVPPRLPPLGRLITPDEVAGTIAFLLSNAAAAITGQTITICGGASLDPA